MKRILSALVLFTMVLGLMSVGFAVSAADAPGAPIATTEDNVLVTFFSNGYTGNYVYAWGVGDDVVTLDSGDAVLHGAYPENSGQKTITIRETSWAGLDMSEYFNEDSNAYLQVMVYNPNAINVSVEFQSADATEAESMKRHHLQNFTPVATNDAGWALYEIKISEFKEKVSWVDVEFDPTNVKYLNLHAHSNTVVEDIYWDDVRIVEKADGYVAPQPEVTPADPTPADPTPADPTPTQPSSSANTFDLTAIALVATAASAAAFAVSKKRR